MSDIHIELKGGLCNRLMALFSIMRHPNFWDFSIYWEYMPGCAAAYYDLFQEPPIHISYYHDLIQSGEWLTPGYNQYQDLTEHKFWKIYYWFSVTKEHVTEESLMTELFEQAHKLVPSHYLGEKIGLLSKYIDENTYGIHVREGVGINYNATCGYFTSIECIIQKMYCILNYNINAKFYISTDSMSAINKLYSLFKDRIIIAPLVGCPIDSGYSKGGMHRAVIDLFVLSKCKKIICGPYTTFPRVANLLSGQDKLEVLYETKNKTREQCQIDSLVYN